MAQGISNLKGSVGTWLLLVVGILGISTSTLWIRMATGDSAMDEVQLAFLRLALAIPVLLILSARDKWVPIGQCGSSVMIAGGCLAIHFGAWMASLAYLSVATSVVLVYLHPVIIYAIEVSRGHARIERLKVGGVLLTLSGTSVLAWFADETVNPMIADQKLWGMGLSVIGSLAFVGYLLAGRTATQRMSTVTYASRAYSVAAVGLLMWLLLSGEKVWPGTATGWTFAGLLALFPTLLGHTPLNAALKRLPPTVVSTTYLGEMAGAPLLVWLVIHEAPPTSFWIGGPMVIAGIMAVAWKSEASGTKSATSEAA